MKNIVVTGGSGKAGRAVVRDLVEDPAALGEADLARIKQVAVNEPLLVNRLISPKAHVTGINITVELPERSLSEVPEVVARVRELAAAAKTRDPNVEIYLTGVVFMNNAFAEQSQKDMATLVPLMYAAIVVIIFLSVRSLAGTFGALLVIIFSIVTTMGITGWLGIKLTPPTASSPTVILTLAVADSIHILLTMFHAIRQGRDKRSAILDSLRINGQPVFLTSATTAVGFLSLNFSEIPPFRDLGNIVAIGVTVAWTYSVFFLPAFMAVVPVRLKPQRERAWRVMDGLANFVIDRRRPLLWGSLLVALGLLAMVPRNTFNDQFVKYFDTSVDFRRDTDFIQENLAGTYQIHYSLAAADSGGISDPAYLRKIDEFVAWYRAQPNVVHVNTLTDTMKRLNKNLHGDKPEWHRLPDSRELTAQYLLLYELSLPFGLDLNDQINVDKSATRVLVTLNNIATRELLALEEKATQLALSSKYKSEFLANMSHELRTPLNSLLILAQQLGDNPEGNLSGRQVEFAKTIHGSGSDLLTLINDILDLSKIESGTVTLDVSEYRFSNLRNYVDRTFRHMAEAKHLGFTVELADALPASVMTDTTRLQQVLKNLLSNAFKFTHHGKVALEISLVTSGWTSDHPNLVHADAVLAFSVRDTGVGIAADKLQLIFEAFQQADGSTARKYGGTGLGLSISRELARLLGGEIRVESVVGGGSTFTLFLPYNRAGFINYDQTRQQQARLPAPPSQVVYAGSQQYASEAAPVDAGGATPQLIEYGSMLDDRGLIAPGDPSVLIIEDDERFAKIVLEFAREKNFKAIVTHHGDSALSLARDYLPSAILLDLDLPDIDGFTVLDRLKRDPSTRHIPVHVMSSLRERERALRQGAISYMNKPVSRETLQEEFTRIQKFLLGGKRSLLVVDDEEAQRDSIVSLIGDGDIRIVTAETGEAALEALRGSHFDCMVLDLTLPDVSGFELLDVIGKESTLRDLPIVIYTAKDLTRKEVTKLKRYAKTIVIKDARSPERLLDETALFLHRSHASLPELQRRMLEEIHAADGGLAGRKVLIVDDDLRNIFALSSLLERQQMQVSFAENGRDGIEVLEKDPSIEIVLMDIMMPEMDGYDTMRAIRRIPKFKSLPIITLTAKAMKGDRDKCIAAGASDYITKPVDVAQLLSLMRVWLH